MNILFLSDNFPPEVNAPATRTYEHCREWVRMGVQVTVVTCAPNYPAGKVFPGYRNRLRAVETVDGIRVVRLWSYITANEGILKRTLDYLSFAGTSLLGSLLEEADVIVATSPQFFTALSGFGLSLFKRKPWIFELRDLWPESIKTVGAMRDGSALHLLKRLDFFLYRRASRIVVVTQGIKNNLTERGIDQAKIHVVTNGANLDLFHPVSRDKELLAKLGLEGKTVLGYIGTHGMAQGLDFILDCAARISDERIHFMFAGDGAEKKNLLTKAGEMSLKNVTFLDQIAKQDIPRYISLTDACLVPLKKRDTFKGAIPSKIFEAAAMAKPILLGIQGEARNIIHKYGAGICFEPENQKSFLEAVNLLRQDEQAYRNMQKGCLALARDYDRKKLALSMLDIIRQTSVRKD